MDANVKERWVAALRSGNYAQARGRLRDGNEFCCLGVLCDVENHDGWKYEGGWLNDGHSSTIPQRVQTTADVDGDTITELVYLNDTLKNNFEQIADWIEENL